jgi:hypothetical protein
MKKPAGDGFHLVAESFTPSVEGEGQLKVVKILFVSVKMVICQPIRMQTECPYR